MIYKEKVTRANEIAMKFVIEGRLDGLNEYTKSNRGNKYGGNVVKQRNENIVIFAIREAKLSKVDKYPIKLKIVWYEKDMRRDSDNVVFAIKFIQDALVKAGILVNDTRNYITGAEHKVLVDKNNPRIEVEIIND